MARTVKKYRTASLTMMYDNSPSSYTGPHPSPFLHENFISLFETSLVGLLDSNPSSVKYSKSVGKEPELKNIETHSENGVGAISQSMDLR